MTKVEIPEGQVKFIQEIMNEYPELGYESLDEYVRSAVREKILREES